MESRIIYCRFESLFDDSAYDIVSIFEFECADTAFDLVVLVNCDEEAGDVFEGESERIVGGV